jgi:DUF3078 family protein
MKKIIALISFTILSISLYAQQDADATLKDIKTTATKDIKINVDSAQRKWKTGALININLTQVSNNNWVAAGGDNFSLSVAGALNAFAVKKWNRTTWNNILDLDYGLVNTTTLGVRKVNDLLNFLSKVDYEPKKWKNVSLSLLAQLRSQLTNGYDYAYFGTTTKRRTSGFFAPAYITFSPGIDWHPASWISVFASPLAARWTIVSNDPYSFASANGNFLGNRETPLATLYGVDSVSGVKTELGAFVTVSIKKDIMKNVTYIGKLDIYSNYLDGPQNVALFSTNQFQMKVNKWLNVNYEIDFLDDNNIKQASNPTRPVGLQVLSTIGVGFAAKF